MIVINANDRKTLIFMEAKVSGVEEDVDDEGDVSDIEEISEETFKQESKPKHSNKQDSRVCLQNVNGRFSSSDSSSLPLNEIVLEVEDSDSDSDESKKGSHEVLVNGGGDCSRKSLNSSKVVCTVIIDDSSDESDGGMEEDVGSGEKGEGEVDQVEIELDVEIDEKAEEEEEEISSNGHSESVSKVSEFDKLVQSLRETLESINAEEADKYFTRVCKMLWCCLERFKLLQLQPEYRVQAIEALIPLAYKGIQTVNSVFCSMTAPQKEQCRAFLSSMLDYAMSPKLCLFPLDQRRKIWAMKRLNNAKCDSTTGEDIRREKDMLASSGKNLGESGYSGETAAVQSGNISENNAETISVDLRVKRNENIDCESLKLGTLSSAKGSKTFSPFFDIHMDHDVDSLPSPTLDTSQPLPVQKTQDVRDSIVKQNLVRNDLAQKLEDGTTCISGTGSLNFDLPRNHDLDSLPSPTRETPPPLLLQRDVTDKVDYARSNKEVDICPDETNAPKAVSSCQLKFRRTSFLSANQLPSPTPSEECNDGVDDSSAEVSSSYHPSGDDMSGQKLDVTKGAAQPNLGLCSAIRTPTKIRDPSHPFGHCDVAGPHGGNLGSTGQGRSGNIRSKKRIIVPNSVLSDRHFKKPRNVFSSPEVFIDAQMASEDNCIGEPKCDETVSPGHLTENTETNFRKSDMHKSGEICMNQLGYRQNLCKCTSPRYESSGSEQFERNATHSLNALPQKDTMIVRQQNGQAQFSQAAPALDVSQQQRGHGLKYRVDIQRTSQSVNNMHPALPQSVSSQPLSVKADKEVTSFVRTASSDQQSLPCSISERSAGHQSQSLWRDVGHILDGYDDEELAIIYRERAKRIEEQKKMFVARKLSLVLDLDHTLLNSAKFVEVEPVHHEILKKKEEQDRKMSQRHLFRLSHMGMWTKLRPGIWNFLDKASKLYELHVYTMGNNAYATEMAKILDPTGVLFAGRVISKGDEGESFDGNERVPKCKDMDGVLGMESAVLILDDSVKVWPHNKLNLIAVERYIYFPCSRRQFGLVGPSLLEIDHDERSEEGTLTSSLTVIERIHQSFFQNQSLDDLDVRNILALEQRKILAGCHILFSRIFPLSEAKPQCHPLWQTAEQFGAVCTNQIDEQVTHVVANSLGTIKVNWALSNRRFVVSPGWVEASALLYRRANELDFAVKP